MSRTRSRWRLKWVYSKSRNCVGVTRPRDERFMWLYGRKFLIAYNHTARFGGHRHCGRGDKMFLIYRVTSRNTCSKGFLWLNGLKFLIVSHHFAKFSGRRPCGSSETAPEIFYVTLQGHMNKGSVDITQGNHWLYIPSLPKLIVIDTVLMVI